MKRFTEYSATLIATEARTVAGLGLAAGLWLDSGFVTAWASLAAGIACCAAMLVWQLPRMTTAVTALMGLAGSVLCGLATYANLAWLIWKFGFPVDVGSFAEGRMGEHYWLGPLLIAYSVALVASLIWWSRRTQPTDPQQLDLTREL